MYLRPFSPAGDTVSLAVLTTSANKAVTAPAIGNRSIRIYNAGTAEVFIAIGDSSVTVTASNGIPLKPGDFEIFLLKNNATHVAAIAAATGSTIYLTTGESE